MKAALNWGLVGQSSVLEREAADRGGILPRRHSVAAELQGMVLDSHRQLLVAACTCCTDRPCMAEEQQQPHCYWGPKGILEHLCLK